jgi:hypothetical protein
MSRFADLSQRLEGRGDKPNPEDPETPAPETPDKPEGEPEPPTEPGKDSSMTTETPLEQRDDYKAGFAAGETAGGKAASDRMNAVFAHADAKGREAHAARLLGRSMSADEIIAELPNFAVASALSEEEQRAAAEEGGRKELREELDKSGNADLGADKDAAEPQSKRVKSDAVWDRANAAVGRSTKKEG